MKRPDSKLTKLFELGVIHTLKVEHKQTPKGATGDTFCVITGEKGEVIGLWSEYCKYLDVFVRHNSVAALTTEALTQIGDWRKYQKQYATDIQEYKRLKAKLGFESD